MLSSWRALAANSPSWLLAQILLAFGCVVGTGQDEPVAPLGPPLTFIPVVSNASLGEQSKIECPEGTSLVFSYQPAAFAGRRCNEPPVG